MKGKSSIVWLKAQAVTLLQPDIKPTLLIAVGNLSRGDDALAPLLQELIEPVIDESTTELITDFQLQLEHALDITGRDRVLFIDAAVECTTPFSFFEQQASTEYTHTSHIMSPAAIMQVYRTITKRLPPPCFLLSIKGESFELGESISSTAEQHLQAAKVFTLAALKLSSVEDWRKLCWKPIL